MSTDIRVWVAALLTLALYSFLYKENPFYRFAEHLFLGLGAGHAIAMGFNNVRDMGLKPLAAGKMIYLIPLVFGILMFARLVKQYSWLSRYPIAILVGIGSGMALRGIPTSQIVVQLRASFVPLNSFNNVIMTLGVLGTLAYFLFTVKHKGPIGTLAYGGKLIMMIAFGAIFGSCFSDNFSLLIGTFDTILGKWLGLVK